MGPTQPIRVVIADDHPVIRAGLATLIAQTDDLELLAEAGDGPEVMRAVEACHPDVVVMDLRLPGFDGATATEEIRKRFPDVRVLVLTTFDMEADIHRCLAAGADGYLLKGASGHEILEGIRKAAAGETVLSRDVSFKLAEHMRYSPLTEREQEVLGGVVAGKSNFQIAADLYITEGTVKAHINRILGKMKVSHRTEAATEAIRRGLITLQ